MEVPYRVTRLSNITIIRATTFSKSRASIYTLIHASCMSSTSNFPAESSLVRNTLLLLAQSHHQKGRKNHRTGNRGWAIAGKKRKHKTEAHPFLYSTPSSSKTKNPLTRTHHNRESYCTVFIRGEFTTSLRNTTPHVSFNVASHLPNGRTGLISGEDAFCNWVDIVQDGSDNDNAHSQAHAQAIAQQYAQEFHPELRANPLNPISCRKKRKDKLSCPPKKGKAQISSTILLLGGYVPEANYTVKVKATEQGSVGGEGRTIFDLWTYFALRYKDGEVVK